MGKKSGKYVRRTPKRRGKGKAAAIMPICMIVSLLVAATVIIWLTQDRSTYQMIVHDGYTGTQEQWLASLVGEETDADAESAYDLAVKNGYKGTESEWVKALVGDSVKIANKSPYKLACENGFDGTLAEWLAQIADRPEKLGRSNDKGKKTEYELACDYGYSGTFIEWLVSVTHDRVFE